jgi:dTDP-glucose pyrophosphorylase
MMTRTTQAVILARGLGTRMRRPSEGPPLSEEQQRAADAGAKGMMPFARPFLDYVLSALADAGISHVVFVIAPGENVIRQYYEANRPSRLTVAFAVQTEPNGTADAVLAARGSVHDAPFLTLNSDNYYPVDAIRELADVGGSGLVAFHAESLIRESGIEAERVLNFALLAIRDDVLVDLVEKPSPEHPLAREAERWVSMNLWSFTPRIFEACAQVQRSSRGELEIQDAVRIAIAELGERFHVVRSHEGILDLSSRTDIEHVAKHLSQIDPHP